MKVVQTIRGLIPRDHLTVSTILMEHDNALVVVTEWRVTAEGPDAPHVKRDAHAIMLATPGVQAEAALTGRIPGTPPAANGSDVTVGLNGNASAVTQSQIG